MKVWILGLAMLAAGCGASSGSASGSTCPDAGTTLSYDNFGSGFMTSYCLRCHGSSDQESGLRFDTQSQVQAHRSVIDSQAAAGASIVNTAMPEGGTSPTDAERKQLGEWLACGAP